MGEIGSAYAMIVRWKKRPLLRFVCTISARLRRSAKASVVVTTCGYGETAAQSFSVGPRSNASAAVSSLRPLAIVRSFAASVARAWPHPANNVERDFSKPPTVQDDGVRVGAVVPRDISSISLTECAQGVATSSSHLALEYSIAREPAGALRVREQEYSRFARRAARVTTQSTGHARVHESAPDGCVGKNRMAGRALGVGFTCLGRGGIRKSIAPQSAVGQSSARCARTPTATCRCTSDLTIRHLLYTTAGSSATAMSSSRGLVAHSHPTSVSTTRMAVGMTTDRATLNCGKSRARRTRQEFVPATTTARDVAATNRASRVAAV